MTKQFLKGNRLYVWNWFHFRLYTTLVTKSEIQRASVNGSVDCHALALVVKDRLAPRNQRVRNKSGQKGQKRFIIMNERLHFDHSAKSKVTPGDKKPNHKHPQAKGKEEREYAKNKRQAG